MPNRTLVWTIAIVAVLLVVVPLLSMAGMMTWSGSSIMNMRGTTMGMSVFGIAGMLLAAAAVIALVVIAVRSVTHARGGV
jgi:hypothetical protein